MIANLRHLLFLVFTLLACANVALSLPAPGQERDSLSELSNDGVVPRQVASDAWCLYMGTCKPTASASATKVVASTTSINFSQIWSAAASSALASMSASSMSASKDATATATSVSRSATATSFSRSATTTRSTSTSTTRVAKIDAPGNTARPASSYVSTIYNWGSTPWTATPTKTTFTSTKTSILTVTSTKVSTLSSSTSTVLATKSLSGSLQTTATGFTIVPVTTVVPVTAVITTTAVATLTSLVTPSSPIATGTPTATFSTTTIAATPTAAPTADPTTPEQQAVVDAHNNYRAKYGAPALTWNQTLADYALAHAQKCIWAHSGGPYGENGAATVGMGGTMASAVDMWYAESASYNFSAPAFSEQTGHFTQLVWAGSHTLGCAVATCSPVSLGFAPTYTEPAYNVWCEYANLPGNVIGQFADMVVPPLGATLVNGMISAGASAVGSVVGTVPTAVDALASALPVPTP